MQLTRFRFQDAEGSSCLDDTRRIESGRGKQIVVLRLRSLPGLPGEHHHGHIQHGDSGVRLAGYGNHLYHEQPVPGTHPLAAPFQDHTAFRICPVVQDLAQDPHIGLDLHRLEEASSHQLAPFSGSSRLEQVLGIGQHVRAVEQNAPDGGIAGDNGGQ